jgi:UDP-N-acetylmuramoyl-tripeptide--D-alanyl-D-alanine ligase
VALVSGALVGALGIASGVRSWRRRQVKRLVFTARARRLLVVSATLCALPFLLLAFVGALGVSLWVIAAAGTLAALGIQFLAPEVLIAGNWSLRPIQALDNRRFVKRARHRLRDWEPLVLAITGSYGKTTTKACVAQVAELRGPAYPTPASYNSFLGVVRAINEGLQPAHRSFIVEMGAYRAGDIAELCEFVRPSIGILTAIGPAHLERFGSLDAIEATKGELAEALPPEGTLITRADDPRCRRAASRAACEVRLFCPHPHPEADVWAEDVELRNGRTTFAIRSRADGADQARVKAKLLGRHNVANLLAAATVGLRFDLPLSAVARALARVEPPPHRLAPIVNQAGGIVVIDDAYNANPEGASAALEVLAEHEAVRRLLVTPGMVELGEAEDGENRRFGFAAAKVCDLVVLVGEEQTAPIRDGLRTAGFPEPQIRVVADADEARTLLADTTRPGDVVLFENDLPDLYAFGNGRTERTAV